MGFGLVAGEFPGGSDHELYPLNVTDPAVARDNSPDPRRHSAGELIPDLVAQKGRVLLIAEAKVDYNEPDKEKLEILITKRRKHLQLAIEKFAADRVRPELLPFDSLHILPALVFTDRRGYPAPQGGMSYLVVGASSTFQFLGPIREWLS